MPADKIPMPASGISTVADLYDLINGKTTETSGGTQTTSGGTTTKTETTGISKESFDAMLASALGSSQGLAAISSGQRAAGGYGSSVNTMLTNDLLTRTASQILANNTSKVTTTTTPEQTISKSPTIQTVGGVTASGVGKSASFLSALQLLNDSGAASWLKKNLKLDADGKPTSDTAGVIASPAGQALQEFTPTMSAVSAADNQIVPMGSVNIGSMMSADTSDFGGSIISASGVDRSVEQTGDDGYVGSIGGGFDISETPITDAGVVTASDLETLEMPQLPDFGEGFADGGLVTPKKQLNVLGTSQFNRVVDPTLGLVGSRGVGVNEYGQPDNSTPVTTPLSNPGGRPRGGSDFTGGNGGNLGSMDRYLTQSNYASPTSGGGGASKGDIANVFKGLSILGTLTGSTDLRNLGTAGRILSSNNPIMSAGLTAANIASKGVVGKGLSLYNTLTKPSTSSVSNLILTAANPAVGVANGIADLFGVATVGEVIENIADKLDLEGKRTQGEKEAIDIFKPSTDLRGSGTENAAGGAQFSEYSSASESDFNSLPDSSSFSGGGDGGSGTADACVHVASYFPDQDKTAGSIEPGDTLTLADQSSLEAGTGVVSYSQTKQAEGWRIETVSGVVLICSDTAPIPTRYSGLVTPPDLGWREQVAVMVDGVASWEYVKTCRSMEEKIYVQHITVGDKCFWAGETKGSYILHHNSKDAGSSGDQTSLVETAGEEGLADGGPIMAPGDGTTDTTLRPLAHGEYVFPKDVVDAIGIDKLDAIKNKYHTPVAVQKLQKFAKGY